MKLLVPFLILVIFNSSFAQDHKENLSGPYETVQQVTEECLMCHEESGEEVIRSNHWNWLSSSLAATAKSGLINGKHIPINNFCLNVSGELQQCTKCHLAYSGAEESFNFNSTENVDCLVCHDQTGTYKRSPFGTGMPETEVDLLAVAQSVGKPTSKNCGICHFSGSGGVKVSHSGLDKSMLEPSEDIDIHMGGMGFGCNDCHETKNHNISPLTESGESTVACQNCHDSNPHTKELLNQHYTAVACETCHIPSYAIQEAAIISWDWSKAGENKETITDEDGEVTYDKRMGEIVWAKNVKPEYYWDNNTEIYYDLGKKFEKGNLIELNKPGGNISDSKAKISPFKVMRVKQPFDPVNKYLTIPRIYAEDGYFNTLNWESTSIKGMNDIALEFSGNLEFVETEIHWPINHMVMSSDNALKCTSCHGKGGEGLLNWKSLGYPSDPIKKGGRVKNKLVKQ